MLSISDAGSRHDCSISSIASSIFGARLLAASMNGEQGFSDMKTFTSYERF
jgi:hypothetical protein